METLERVEERSTRNLELIADLVAGNGRRKRRADAAVNDCEVWTSVCPLARGGSLDPGRGQGGQRSGDCLMRFVSSVI